MKLRNLFAGAMVMAAAIFSGCEPEEQLGLPDVVLGATDLEFTQEAGSQEIKVTATREWKVEYDAEWIAVTPDRGQGSNDEQKLTVTVTENTGANRTAKVTVTIGMVQKAFNVNQAGPGGATDGIESLTVKAFIEKADTENYYRLSGKVSGFNATYCSFDLTDETGKIYVYSVTDESKAEWSSKIKNGGTVVIQGRYLYYEQKSQHEVVDAIIESFTTGSTEGGNDNPSTPVDAIYYNDFDKETSAKGSDGKWPYCDTFDGWKNQKGSGAANVTYAFKSASPRATNGNNNIWLPKTGAYLTVQDIALGEATSLKLSFNVICGSPGDYKKQFNASAFKVWLSADKAKWVELPVTITANDKEFDDAVATFSVPASTSALSITFEKIPDETDGYRIDNVELSASTAAGTAVDFTKGVSKEFGTGSADSGDGDNGDSGNTTPGQPSKLTKVTIAEFKTKAVNTTDWYELTGEIIEIQGDQYGNFVIEDETDNVLIYGMTSKWVGTNDQSFSELGLKVGDVVTLGTLRADYKGTPQGGGKEIPAYYISHTSGDDAGDGGNTGDDNTGDDNTGDGDTGDGDNGDDNTGDGDTGDGDNGDDNTGDGDTGDGDNGDDNTGDGGDTNWSYTFVKEDVKDGFGEVYSAPVSVAFNGLTWKLEMQSSTYLGFDSSIGRGLQMGKSKEPATSITLSTEGISGTIKKIVVNTSGAKNTDAKLSVYVGGTAMGSQVAVTTTATDYTFEGSASGKIELKWTNSAAAAVYVKSISIEFE